MTFHPEKKKNSTCPSCPSNLSRIFPVRKNPKNKSKKKSEKSPEPSPGAPGRRALLLLHFFGGLLGHLQVRLEAGFGDFLVDYDGLWYDVDIYICIIYILYYIHIIVYIVDFDISLIYNYIHIYIYDRMMIIPQRNHMEIMVLKLGEMGLLRNWFATSPRFLVFTSDFSTSAIYAITIISRWF